MSDRPSLHSFRPGDRVARRYDGKIGVVHAVYPDDLEDDTEVKFNDDTWTCSNHSKFQKLGETPDFCVVGDDFGR